jgi:hypothetical protein
VPAAVVYAALLDAESWSSWTSYYEVEMELPAGVERPVRVGDLRTIRSRFGRVSCRERIVELVPNQRFSYEQAAGPLASHQGSVNLTVFTAAGGNHVWRTSLNDYAWKPALVAAGVLPAPATKDDAHSAAREHGMHALRHFYASALLDSGENIKAVSEYLGHSNAALTLRIYAHLMPSSQARTRTAIATVYDRGQRSL